MASKAPQAVGDRQALVIFSKTLDVRGPPPPPTVAHKAGQQLCGRLCSACPESRVQWRGASWWGIHARHQ